MERLPGSSVGQGMEAKIVSSAPNLPEMDSLISKEL